MRIKVVLAFSDIPRLLPSLDTTLRDEPFVLTRPDTRYLRWSKNTL